MTPMHPSNGAAVSPFISIIVAVRNRSATLQRCIDSVAGQTHRNRELIIIDGGSDDGTVALLHANRDKISCWISEPDGGIYGAWNKGLRHARGEWICFLGADDYFWETQALEQMAMHLEKMPADILIAYGRVMIVNAQEENLYLIGEPWRQVKERFKQVMCIPHTGAMHHRRLFARHGTFDESFRIAGDYEMLLRELKSADALFVPDCIVAAMRVGGISSIHGNTRLTLRETRRATRRHGYLFPGKFWFAAMASLYMRSMLWRLFGESRARKALDWGRRHIKRKPPFWTRT